MTEDSSTRWDPAQYLKFSDDRLRPGLDLMHRISSQSPRHICDLGCGTGTLTRLLAARWPEAAVTGVDHSADMLATAAAEPSTVEWVESDLRTWQPTDAPDLIYSNATLHWVEGHERLFPHLLALLQRGGALAVQMPLSWGQDSHLLMRQVLEQLALGDDALRRTTARKWVDEPAAYYDLLAPLCAQIDLWQTEYLHVLSGDDPVLEWVQSTGLRPILNGLDDDQRAEFLTEYRTRLRQAYPRRADGTTLYPFRRLFIVATTAP